MEDMSASVSSPQDKAEGEHILPPHTAAQEIISDEVEEDTKAEADENQQIPADSSFAAGNCDGTAVLRYVFC
jgi:hypothetical protein